MVQLDRMVRPVGAPKDTSNTLSLVYNGNRRSSIEPCACKSHRLGGIDREARITSRVLEWGPPLLNLDAGGFSRMPARSRDRLTVHHMMGALKAMGCDAINVGLPDLSLGATFFDEAKTSWSPPLISANIVDETSAPVFAPYKVVELELESGGKVRAGIIGVTRQGPVAQAKSDPWASDETSAPVLTILDPAEALARYLPELREKADFVVLLTYQTREAAQEFLKKLGPESGIDLAIASEMTVGKPVTYYRDNFKEADGVRVAGTWMEGRSVAYMMVSFRDGKPVSFANRLIEIEQSIPPLPKVTEIVDRYLVELTRPDSDGR
jgi:2',3'-cyclic-nucleotide 2'-phosphodiesterase (5'-nucleotidase family)